MNKFLFGIFLLCAGSIAGITLLMADDFAAPSASQFATVGVESGKVAIIADNHEAIVLEAGDQYPAASDANRATTAAPSPAPEEIALPNANAPVETIPNQTIAAALPTEPAQNASAPSAVKPQSEDVSAAPDYLCSFEIIVNSKKEADGNPGPIKPIPGADVIVWKGQDIPRPIVDTVQIPLLIFGKGNSNAVLTRKDDGIYVETYAKKETTDNSEPNPGDRLIGLDGYTYLADASLTDSAAHIYIPASEKDNQLLRIWDTLTAYSRMSFGAQMEVFLEFKHNGQEKHIISHLCKIETPHSNEIVAQGTTNAAGRCVFENLPPGIYFVQARKDNRRSMIATLSPARRGVKMWLGDPALSVVVEKKNVEISQLKGIQGAQVQLEGVSESIQGRFMETTQEMGRAQFNNLPWGTYRLTVTPPADIAQAPQIRMVELEELYQREYVKFETPNQIHELSGKIIRKDNNAPVKDFTLELALKAQLNGDAFYGDAKVKTKSAEDGSFRFTKIQSGVYELASGFSDEYNGFLAEDETLLPSGGNWYAGGQEVRIDKDIADYKFLVLPGVETKFSGQVVKADGNPAANVPIHLDQIIVREREGETKESQRHIPIIPNNPKTDKDGKFEFSFTTTPDSEIHKGIILATVAKESETEAQAGMSGSGSGGYGMMMYGAGGVDSRDSQPGAPQAMASYPIEFKLGDFKTGLKIVLQDVVPYVIGGKLTSEDGGLPDGLQIYTYFQNQFYYAKIDREGNYRLEIPKAGKVEMQITGSTLSGTKIPGTPDKYGSLCYFKYCNEFPTVDVSDENRTVRLDVKFQKGYFLLGRVLDKNQNPIKKAWIEAFSPATVDPQKQKTDSYNVSQTNEQGYFGIPGLRRNLEHRIIVRNKMRGDILAQMDGVIPEPAIGDNVILFTVNNPK